MGCAKNIIPSESHQQTDEPSKQLDATRVPLASGKDRETREVADLSVLNYSASRIQTKVSLSTTSFSNPNVARLIACLSNGISMGVFGSADPSNPSRRKRNSACNRCRAQKIRCGNQEPACSNCVKAGVACVKPVDIEASRL